MGVSFEALNSVFEQTLRQLRSTVLKAALKKIEGVFTEVARNQEKFQ